LANYNFNKALWDKIFQKQKHAIKTLKFGRAKGKQSCRGIFEELGILTISSICICQAAIYAFKYLKGNTNQTVHCHNTWKKKAIHISHSDRKDPMTNCSIIFNQVPDDFKQLPLKGFEKKLKAWL